MRARRFSRHTSARLDNYFHIDRSNFFLVTTSLPGTTVDPFPKNRAQRSIGLLSVCTLVCQAPHALHALCVLCGPLVSQGAPISKSVCECFTQPWCGRLVSVCVG